MKYLLIIALGIALLLGVHHFLPNLLNGYHQVWQTLEGFMQEEMKFRHTDPVFLLKFYF